MSCATKSDGILTLRGICPTVVHWGTFFDGSTIDSTVYRCPSCAVVAMWAEEVSADEGANESKAPATGTRFVPILEAPCKGENDTSLLNTSGVDTKSSFDSAGCSDSHSYPKGCPWTRVDIWFWAEFSF